MMKNPAWIAAALGLLLLGFLVVAQIIEWGAAFLRWVF